MIEVEHLTKRFGPTKAVSDISFSVARGEVLGFLGPNGAGKTTTMRIMTGYLPADEGRVAINGVDISRNSLEFRRVIGYLPENAPLYSDMNVVDYLVFIARMRGMRKTQKRVQEMIDLCSLERVLKKDIGELSKGYRQRVGLAQAMIHDPDILILDEPTSGLDPAQIIKTVILSSHILPEVSATCDRILIIDRGKIVADGTAEELSRRAQGEEKVIASFKNAPPEQIRTAISALEGVSVCRQLPDETGWEILAGREGDIEERIFHLAVEKGWVLTALTPQRINLEDIFLRITTQGTGNDA
jgi:ABC-2 type transport system ATP-binding protein